MNSVLGHDAGLVRLYVAGDNFGLSIAVWNGYNLMRK